ncbi:hypothetical protein COO60DRAFT_1464306 [Scenedesmus sp. NREL 46B-D3]|nr:hypothetical protein COO60DRAFT_1464306 [Scenedesmus sp. NREL 46B-D3]
MITTLISYVSHSQVWALQQGCDVYVVGKSNRSKVLFEQELDSALDAVPEVQQVAAVPEVQQVTAVPEVQQLEQLDTQQSQLHMEQGKAAQHSQTYTASFAAALNEQWHAGDVAAVARAGNHGGCIPGPLALRQHIWPDWLPASCLSPAAGCHPVLERHHSTSINSVPSSMLAAAGAVVLSHSTLARPTVALKPVYCSTSCIRTSGEAAKVLRLLAQYGWGRVAELHLAFMLASMLGDIIQSHSSGIAAILLCASFFKH